MFPIMATTFKDILKSSYLDNVTSVNLIDIVLGLFLSFVLGLFICYVYKKTFQGVMYSQCFSVSLIAMTLITTFIILAITSNVVLSLGMVGALSIVRFRSAIKEPIDIAYLFWSIAVGIVVGAGMILLAVIGSVVIGIVLIVFSNKDTKDTPYILVINCENDSIEKKVMEKVAKSVNKHVVKSKSVSKLGVELTMEIRLQSETTTFVNEISALQGVASAVLVSYNGDYMS